MPLIKQMVSSENNEWATPLLLFDKLNKEFRFTLDPCADKQNAKCEKYYTIKQNGLMQDWSQDIVFMNPPYSRQTRKWIEKSYLESLKGAIVVCLIVNAANRSYWHDYIFPFAAQIRWLRGKIKFEGAKFEAPFGNAIIIFDDKKEYDRKQIYYQKPINKLRLF